jgi:hypothetical protein
VTDHATIPAHQTTVDRYIATWNETDPAARRDLVTATWAPAASYVDPLMRGEGHDGIDAMVAAVQGQFPGHRFRLVAGPEEVAGHLRFAWEMGPDGGETLIAGTDFATLDADGRLATVIGFIDRMPAPPAS